MHRRLFCKILSKHYCCFLENWKKQQNGQVFWSKFTFFLVNWEIYLKKCKISLKNSSKSEKNSRIFFKNSVNRRLRASVSLHKMSKKKPVLITLSIFQLHLILMLLQYGKKCQRKSACSGGEWVQSSHHLLPFHG